MHSVDGEVMYFVQTAISTRKLIIIICHEVLTYKFKRVFHLLQAGLLGVT